jgi:hypothetical protein
VVLGVPAIWAQSLDGCIADRSIGHHVCPIEIQRKPKVAVTTANPRRASEDRRNIFVHCVRTDHGPSAHFRQEEWGSLVDLALMQAKSEYQIGYFSQRLP